MASWQEAAAAQGLRPATPGPKTAIRKSNPLDYYKSKLYGPEDIKGRVISIYGNEGFGKTVLAAKLGTSNLFITDDNGILSLGNHSELDAKSIAIPFEGYEAAIEVLDYVDSGEFINPRTGTPFDNVNFDTISGMCSTEIRASIEGGAIETEKGKLAQNIPTRPHYLLNEQNFGPLMKRCAQMRNSSVTLLSHLRTGTKDIPGASTHADLHGAAYKLMAKYSSVVAYLHVGTSHSDRRLRVMPDNITGAKTRYNFGSSVLSDAEFVAKVEQWKLNTN